jgi:hypothetical protein
MTATSFTFRQLQLSVQRDRGHDARRVRNEEKGAIASPTS